MSQGLLKKLKKSNHSNQIKNKGITKKGAKIIAPKHKSKITSNQITKKLLGKCIANTEQQLAPKAAATGKLTILKPLLAKKK